MSVERVTKWTCDVCEDIRYLVGYGLPPGWKWHHRPGGIVHTCSKACEELLDSPD